MVLFWGVIAALPALIHARLHGCAQGVLAQNKTIPLNPNCLLIINHL